MTYTREETQAIVDRMKMIGRELEEAQGEPLSEEFIKSINIRLDVAAGHMATLFETLKRAMEDLQHMAGCPSCVYNRAPYPHTDTAICGNLNPFPLEGCYTWRGARKEDRP